MPRKIKKFCFITVLISINAYSFADFTIIQPNSANVPVTSKSTNDPNELERLQNENLSLKNEIQRIHQINKTRTEIAQLNAETKSNLTLSGNKYQLVSKYNMNELIQKGHLAKKVMITVFTDSQGKNKNELAHARSQGNNLKQLLSNKGVNKQKIQVRVLTNHYIASNKTATDRAKNRRISVNFQ